MKLPVVCERCEREVRAPKGSLKHPYCQACFRQVWCDDSEAYGKWFMIEQNKIL